MAGMSISWRAASRPAAVLAIIVAAIPLLPHLLRTPEPPAPDPSVGLPAVEVYAPVAGREAEGPVPARARMAHREVGKRERADDGRERAEGRGEGAGREERSTAPEPRPEASAGGPASPVVAEMPTPAPAVTPVAAPPAPPPASTPQPEPAPPSPSPPPEPSIDQEFGP
jgi:hypothetical protein